LTIRTSLAATATIASVALLSACGGGSDVPTDTAAYPEYTLEATETAPPNPDLTPPGTVLGVGASALIGYHSLAPDDSGTMVPSKEEQPIHVTVTGIQSASISSVPAAFRMTGADSDAGATAVKKVTWEATIDGASIISMVDQSLNFTAGGAASYLVSDPTAISGCPGPASLGAAFDSGSTVQGCFLIVYLKSAGAPDVNLSVFRTDTEANPIVWR
jgi:hypothetical protein